ncbi:hypothetical protein ACFQE1_12365 [Halobium palmae]|uniref:Uncharacterized protein n=1 Tax=Halobium palmae TaxID=1776492 RepID=A0ABD5S0V3_9EURY
MEHRTIESEVVKASNALENVVDAEGYARLDAEDRAAVQEALHQLALVESRSSERSPAPAESAV